MTDDMITLGKRATACKGWRWMAGMKIANGIRVTESLVPFTFASDVPDLSDPATMGCLLALVREAYGDQTTQGRYFTGEARWCVCSAGGSILADGRYFWGESEAEALVAVLEAAP